MIRRALVAAALLWALPATAEECPSGMTCIPDADMAKLTTVLEEKRCLQTTKPTFSLDPINIVVDNEGRVFYSGANPNPYTLRMQWCNYDAEAQGKVNVVAALREPSQWGFRFRMKAWFGILPIEALNIIVENEAAKVANQPTNDLRFSDVWDGGVMVDWFHYDWFNLNVSAGFKSFGGGIGADLTPTVGVYVGYANTWATWHHNLNLALSVALW